MIRKFLFLCILCPLLAMAGGEIKVELLRPHFVGNGDQGVSAPFVGMVNDTLMIAGGCNFPKVPAAEGGKKKIYDTIWYLGKDGWYEETFTLPAPLAYGAYVGDGHNIICIGGTNGKESLNDTYILNTQKVRAFKSLPYGIEQGAAATDGKYIYVVGGLTNGEPNMQVLRIEYPDGKEWECVATLPDQARVQPACVIQSDGTNQCLYIFGGYDPEKKEISSTTLQLNLKTFSWNVHEDSWATAGMTALPCGYSHVLVFGGVDKERFETAISGGYGDDYLTHTADWYRFNRDILVYHTITNSWYRIHGMGYLYARAGAGALKHDNAYYQLDGEVKPGIRGTEIVKTTFISKKSFGWLNWTVLVIYLLSMLGLGFFFMQRESGSDDFFRGGGRIPWWAAGISIYATMLSAITYMAIPAKAYATDWTYYPMLITILMVSWPVVKWYLPYFRKLNITSAYEYLEMRFNAATRLMASGIFIVFMMARMALVLYLPSLALTAVTGIDINTCILLMGIVTIIYCTMGGVEAVIWGDVVQGCILVGGAFMAAWFLISHTEGGAENFIQLGMDNNKFRLFDWSLDYRSATFWVAILGGMANNLISYTSDQTVIQRYLTTKDIKTASNSIWMNGVMSVFISIVFYFIGTGLYTFYKTHPESLDLTMTKGDTIFPYFMMSQLPQGVAGLLIAAIFAATMSTISSNINSISTAFSIDFWKRFRPQTSDRKMLYVARMTCVVSGVIGVAVALMMATWDIPSLVDYFNTVLGLFSSGLGGLFVMGIFLPRIGGRSALVGFVAGTAVVFWMHFCTDASFFLFGLVGMIVSVLVAWCISLVKKNY